ncbi:MAG: methyltransferase domain-containing protein [Candidatus Micrarchaeota archaeon]
MYLDKVFKGDFSRLDNEQRRERLPPTEILTRLGIKKGDTLLDFGCGIGYFSIPALEFVGNEGEVIAIDLSERMLGELKKRAGERRNLRLVQSDKLGGFKADIVLLVNVLHEVENPKEFLEDSFSNLKPNGRVVIIDAQKKAMDTGPPLELRIALEELLSMTNKKRKQHPIHDSMYFVEFYLG